MSICLSIFQLGSLVTLKVSFLGEPVGTICYVYENYDSPGLSGVSLLTQNGLDLGGFSIEEQGEYLEYYGDTGKVYDFRNVGQLSFDIRNGVFDFFLKDPTKYKFEKPKKYDGPADESSYFTKGGEHTIYDLPSNP